MVDYVLVAGGTGGHVFPAVRLAYELNNSVFVTDERGIKFLGKPYPFKDCYIQTLRPFFFIKMAVALIKSLILLRRLKPSVVIGFGGYPSVPCVFAAQMLGIKTVIQEQNVFLGKANRFLAKKADLILGSFPSSSQHPKMHVIGNLVRKPIEDLFSVPYVLPKNTFHILIIGGSQGAKIFSDVLPKVISSLPKTYKDRLVIHQQVRSNQETDLYPDIKVKICPFFKNIEQEYRIAHLVIARAGASTLTELSVASRPAIIVPYTFTKEGDQANNLNYFKDAVVSLNEDQLDQVSFLIQNFMDHPWRLEHLSKQIRSLAKPSAVKKAARLCEELRGQSF